MKQQFSGQLTDKVSQVIKLLSSTLQPVSILGKTFKKQLRPGPTQVNHHLLGSPLEVGSRACQKIFGLAMKIQAYVCESVSFEEKRFKTLAQGVGRLLQNHQKPGGMGSYEDSVRTNMLMS